MKPTAFSEPPSNVQLTRFLQSLKPEFMDPLTWQLHRLLAPENAALGMLPPVAPMLQLVKILPWDTAFPVMLPPFATIMLSPVTTVSPLKVSPVARVLVTVRLLPPWKSNAFILSGTVTGAVNVRAPSISTLAAGVFLILYQYPEGWDTPDSSV